MTQLTPYYIFSEKVYEKFKEIHQSCVEELNTWEGKNRFPRIQDVVKSQKFSLQNLQTLIQFLADEICPNMVSLKNQWTAKDGSSEGVTAFSKLTENMKLAIRLNDFARHKTGTLNGHTFFANEHARDNKIQLPDSQAYEKAFHKKLRGMDFISLKSNLPEETELKVAGVTNRWGYADLISFVAFEKSLDKFKILGSPGFSWDNDVFEFVKNFRTSENEGGKNDPEPTSPIENQVPTQKPKQKPTYLFMVVAAGITGILILIRSVTPNNNFFNQSNFFQNNQFTGDHNVVQLMPSSGHQIKGPVDGKDLPVQNVLGKWISGWEGNSEHASDNIQSELNEKPEKSYFNHKTNNSLITVKGIVKDRATNTFIRGVTVTTADGKVGLTDEVGHFAFIYPSSKRGTEMSITLEKEGYKTNSTRMTLNELNQNIIPLEHE